MVISTDVLVLGGGAMGSATAWQLASRNREVTLLERFGPGHTNGASHGASRNFNNAYADPDYLDLLKLALPLWRELEQQTNTRILDQVGLVNHGARAGLEETAAALPNWGFRAEFLDRAEASSRWPGIRFDGRVLFTPDAGRVNADAAVSALQSATRALGGIVRHHSRVVSIRIESDDAVVVEVQPQDAGTGLPAGPVQTYRARRVVSTLGAWTETLLSGIVDRAGIPLLSLPRLVVTQEQPAHFRVRDESFVWPGFNHAPSAGDPTFDYWYSGVYGMLTPGQGVKAGWHGVGPVLHPDERTFTPEPVQLAALQRYVREWLPGADPDDFTAISCTYTTTQDSNFILDRVGPLIIGAGFSGHGFKFTPAIGSVLADLTTGTGSAAAQFAVSASRVLAAL